MTAAVAVDESGARFSKRLLDGIERLGNKVPHPAIMFFYLILGVIVALARPVRPDASVTEQIAVPVTQPVTHDFSEDTVQPGVTGLRSPIRMATSSRSRNRRSRSTAS